MNRDNLNELLYQALETEQGGVRVYEAALRCAVDKGLRAEWTKYLEQTRKHVDVLADLFGRFGLDAATLTPGRGVVSAKAQALVDVMDRAQGGGNPEAAQLAAAECVVDAETKDHQNWELLAAAAKALEGDEAQALREACEAIEPEEDEHLYHTSGWTRELWLAALGLPAVLPPPEERKNVDTAEGAARAKRGRARMLRRPSARRTSARRKGGRKTAVR